jgi:WD40 repeat protein
LGDLLWLHGYVSALPPKTFSFFVLQCIKQYSSLSHPEMSQRKTKPKNKPSLSNPISQSSSSTTSLHLSCFHPSKPLFAAATTAIGQNVIRIYDTDRPVRGAQDVRAEIRLKRDEEVSCLRWAGYEGKKRKRASTAGELVVGMTSGKIYIVEQTLGEISRTLEGHSAPVLAWTVDEDRGWSCGGDGKIKCWDVRTGSCLLYGLFR